MKKKLILGAMAFAVGFALACVGNAGDAPVQILGAHPFNEQCQLDESVQTSRGSFDLAGARLFGASGPAFADFILFFELKSEFTQREVRQGTNTLADDSRNGVYIDQVQLSYRSVTQPAIAFESETYPRHGYIEPGGSLFAATDLIGEKAAQKLLDTLNPASPAHTVAVNLRFRGYTAGSTGATFLTNDIEFPITFYDSGLTCAGRPRFHICGGVSGQSGASCAPLDGGI